MGLPQIIQVIRPFRIETTMVIWGSLVLKKTPNMAQRPACCRAHAIDLPITFDPKCRGSIVQNGTKKTLKHVRNPQVKSKNWSVFPDCPPHFLSNHLQPSPTIPTFFSKSLGDKASATPSAGFPSSITTSSIDATAGRQSARTSKSRSEERRPMLSQPQLASYHRNISSLGC